MKDTLTSPCQPYDLGGSRPDPVDIWAIIDRLDEFELKRLALALAFSRPDVFEERILEFWVSRQHVLGGNG